MRLLNVHTGLLEEFIDAETAPKYAILSHTWDKEEVTFQDLETETYKSKTGYRKIEGCCLQAVKDGYDYVWVDTCCIDKKSLTELSEAINSMYEWYSVSAVCYVYLADVEIDETRQIDSSLLENCRWLTRGWTLQELLAPNNIVFFDHSWRAFGCMGQTLNHRTVPNITSILPAITRIDETILLGRRLIRKATAAERLSWAANRQTTRKEDMAYCLLGILGVNMPLLYGEGNMAFIRLQQEYIRQYNDPTLLLWGLGMTCQDTFWESTSGGALSPSVSFFSGFSSCPRMQRTNVLSAFSCTNNGIEVDLPLLDIDKNIKLACFGTSADLPLYRRKSFNQTLTSRFSPRRRFGKGRIASTSQTIIALPLLYCPNDSRGDFNIYDRASLWPPFLIPESLCWKAKWTRVYLKGASIRPNYMPISLTPHREYDINIDSLIKGGFCLEAAYPPTYIICTRTRVTIIVEPQGIRPFLFVFKGPNNISLGLLIEYQFEKSKLLHLYKVLGEITMTDLLHHLLPGGKTLSERARNRAWIGLRGSLQGTRDTEASSLKISGKRLGNLEIDHATVSAQVNEWAKAKFVSIKLLWQENRVNQSDG